MGFRLNVRSLERQANGSVLARNTAWMLFGRGIRLLLQAVYFLLIARALGAGQYGAFVGAVSLISIAASFSGWGFGWILVERVSRDRECFAQAFGKAILMTLLSGMLLLSLVLLFARLILGASFPLLVLVLVGISDLFAVRLIDLAAQAFQAVEVLQKAAEVDVVLGATRTAAAATLMFAVKSPNALVWSGLYLLSSAAAAIYAVVLVRRILGMPKFHFRLTIRELKDGFYYAISTASQSAYNDIDKTMLVRIVGFDATGIYGAAYRIVDVAFAPVASLVYASSARFFRHGVAGVSGSTKYAKRLLPYTVAYGLGAAVLLVVVSPLIGIVLGHNFALVSEALCWLSPLILFRGIHYLFSNALTSSGFQRLRSLVQIAFAGINVILNLWLMPLYSWRGAACASLITDGLLVLTFWYATYFLDIGGFVGSQSAQADTMYPETGVED